MPVRLLKVPDADCSIFSRAGGNGLNKRDGVNLNSAEQPIEPTTDTTDLHGCGKIQEGIPVRIHSSARGGLTGLYLIDHPCSFVKSVVSAAFSG